MLATKRKYNLNWENSIDLFSSGVFSKKISFIYLITNPLFILISDTFMYIQVILIWNL